MHRLVVWLYSHVSPPLLKPCSSYLFSRYSAFSYSLDTSEIFYDQLLKSCHGLPPLKQIHSALTTTSLVTNSLHLGAQIITKYAKFDDLNSARLLFDSINVYKGKPNSFLFNTMIRAYANVGQGFETLKLYSFMRRMDISVNNYTHTFLFKACALNSLVLEGKVVHGDALKNGFDSDLYVEAALVDMYGKCGLFVDCRKVFDEMSVKDLVCWTAMITASEPAEKPEEALILFQKMQQEEGLLADSVTIVSVASTIGQLGDAKSARSVHGFAIRNWLIKEISVGNSILAMHARCGDMEKARLVFDRMEERDVISWNSMLSGYTQNGQASEALLLFDEMCDSECIPNPVTALIMVSCCAYMGSCHLGKKFHDFIIYSGMEIDTNLSNALVGMYAKCGDLEKAVDLFNGIDPSDRNVTTWNLLISGYGMRGHGKEALELFLSMQKEGVEPDHISFTSILSSCSHAGLIDEGRKCFADMKRLSITPEVKHYACVVDMLGRAGLLQEAFDLVKEMSSPPDDGIWGALLLACKLHGNMELGEIAANNLRQLEPNHSGYHVLISNIYAASNKWQEVGKLRQDMKKKGLKKAAAFSVIEYGEEILGFHTTDQQNPYRHEVYRKVESIAIAIKMAGHVPDLSCGLHDVEDEDKDHILNYHSEKLAVAFGILKIDPSLPIRVTKNLRICNDCHSAFKFISDVYRRKIIVRDINRFHHFEGGSCSCKDYW